MFVLLIFLFVLLWFLKYSSLFLFDNNPLTLHPMLLNLKNKQTNKMEFDCYLPWPWLVSGFCLLFLPDLTPVADLASDLTILLSAVYAWSVRPLWTIMHPAHQACYSSSVQQGLTCLLLPAAYPQYAASQAQCQLICHQPVLLPPRSLLDLSQAPIPRCAPIAAV